MGLLYQPIIIDLLTAPKNTMVKNLRQVHLRERKKSCEIN